MLSGKITSVLVTTLSILSLKIAIQQAKYNFFQLFEMLFYIWGIYALLSILYLTCQRKVSMFGFKVANPWFLAHLMCLYTISDVICLLYMNLGTYCVLRLCLTATFHVIEDSTTKEWVYTS